MGGSLRNERSYEWTSDEIKSRLGCSTIVFGLGRLLEIEDIVQMREAGITRIEICALGTPGHVEIQNRPHILQVMSECEKQGVSVVSMHSPNLPYDSEEEDIRRNAVSEGILAAKLAEEFGAKVLVCHFRLDKPSEESVRDMLDQLQGNSIKLAIENGKDLSEYTSFVDRIDSDQFGMVVDIGHTRDQDGVNPFVKKERARENMVQCGKRLIHLHLHDWVSRDHVSPLDGSIQWGEIFAAFKDIAYEGVFMFEALYPPMEEEACPEYVLGKVASFPVEFVNKFVVVK